MELVGAELDVCQLLDLYKELLKEEMGAHLDLVSLLQLSGLSSRSSHCSLQCPPNYDLRWGRVTQAS